MPRRSIDLNADLGEFPLGVDPGLLPHVTSVSIACGVHAGSPALMRGTVALALRHGAAIGAHPGLPDPAGFGRADRPVTPRDVEDLVASQVGALAGVAALEGARLRHVKPHGALYTMAADNPALAQAIAKAVAAVDPALILVALAGSVLVEAGRRVGLRTAREAFVDRAYDARGRLVARSAVGAVLGDPDVAAARAVRLVTSGVVTDANGSDLRIEADTLCLHGDTPGAVLMAARVRRTLEEAGVEVRPL
ncbi:MAG: LamB/YcsF family protein [Acidimicrobiia bacterium]|nr:LamB/YcsF family protein [Acidimicrobiia bacterium]